MIDLDLGIVLRHGEQQHLTPNERELLVYLAARAGRDVPREELHQRVWGHSARVISRAVTLTVHRLRRKIEPDALHPVYLVTGATGYRWVPHDSPAKAAAGEVVLLMALRSAPGGAAWLSRCAEIARTSGLYLAELSPDRALFASEALAPATRAAEQLVDPDVRLGIARGQAECLVDPLSGRTLYGGPLLQQVTRAARSSRPCEPPSLAEPSPPPSPGPEAPSPPLIGRDQELSELRLALSALRPGEGIAVVGPAGVGKTRLAATIVREMGGVIVPLDQASDFQGALQAISAALGLASAPDVALAAAAALEELGAPMLLDGADGALSELGELLEKLWRAAPEAKLILTSRERPSIPRLRPIELRGLSAEHGAALLRERCRDLPEEVDLGPLVERLDGLPLAIELVAPRLRTISPSDLGEGPSALLDALVLRSMRRALELSFERLDRYERQMLVQATVFAGPFRLEDASQVLAASDPDAPWFVDTLQSLCDRYLLQRQSSDGPARFSLLSTVRAFAREQGGLGDAPLRHARYVTSRWGELSPLGPPPFGADLMPELRLAARTAADLGEVALLVRAATALAHGAQFYGGLQAAIRALTDAEALPLGHRERARVAQSRAQLYRRLGRLEEARAAIREALSAARSASDPDLIGRVEMQSGLVEMSARDLPAARASFERAAEGITPGSDAALALGLNRAALCHASGEPREGLLAIGPLLEARSPFARAYALGISGSLHASLGELQEAVRCLGASVALLAELGERFQALNFRLLLAETLAAQEREEEAEETFRASLQQLALLGSTSYGIVVRVKLVLIALSRADVALAKQWSDQALALAARCDDARAIGMLGAVRCEILARSGETARAAEAAAAAQATLERCKDRESIGHLSIHRGMAALAAGDPEAAGRELALAEGAAEALGMRSHMGLRREIRRLRREMQRQ